MTTNQTIIEGLRRADKDVVDAMDVASSVMELIEAVDREGVDEAAASFRQKLNSALSTYVSACQSQAGITIPDRLVRNGDLGKDGDLGEEGEEGEEGE